MRTFLAAVMAFSAVACHQERDQEDIQESYFATVSVKVDHVDGAIHRSADDDANAAIEGMRQLIIVVLRENGTVEDMRKVDFGGYKFDTYYDVFQVVGGEGKKIYAIANPDATGFDFDNYPAGSAGFEAAFDSHVYTFDPSLPIAMTDSRVIDADQLEPGVRTDVNLNLARVATKFSIDITNLRDEEVEITSLTINAVAGRQYAMPHFAGEDGKYIIDNNGWKGFDFGELTDMHWSDWLKLAVDESQAAPADTTLADRRGWIVGYSVPADADHQDRPISLPSQVKIAKNTLMAMPVQYFAESRSGLLSNSEFGGGAGAGYEQEYTATINFKSVEGGDKCFDNVVLPNVRALFRNTHVVVHIFLYQEKVKAEVRVVPYVGIVLDPVFGWRSLPADDDKPDPDLRK